MVWPVSVRGRRVGVSSAAESRPLISWLRSCPVTVLLGAAVLVWLAGALLTGLTDMTSSPTVITVASVDGSPDDQPSGGGTPKSPGASQPRDGGSDGGSAAAERPAAASPSKPDSGGGSEQSASGNTAAQPAPRPEAKPASDTNTGDAKARAATARPEPVPSADTATKQSPSPARPDTAGGAGNDANPAGCQGGPCPRPAPGDRSQASQGRDCGGDCSRIASALARMQPRLNPLSEGAPAGGRPDKPGSQCGGQAGCGDQPPVAPAPPAPGGTPNAGPGAGGAPSGAGKAHGQSGTADDNPPTVLAALQKMQPQQPAGAIPKNQAPHSGLDPPVGAVCSSGGGTCAPAAVPAPPAVPVPGGEQPQQPCAAGPCLKPPAPTAAGTDQTGMSNAELTRLGTHAFLAGASMVPGANVIASGADAALYASEGDWGNAAISVAGMVPFVSDITGGARLAITGAKLGRAAVKAEEATKAAEAAEAAKTGLAAKNAAHEPAGSPPQPAPPNQRPDFVANENGTVIPTSKARLEDGFQRAGFPAKPTAPSAGTQYTLPDQTMVRVMEPSGPAPLRASFTNSNGGPISAFTGKPVQPPPGLTKPERVEYVRARTHVELGR